MEDLQTRFDEQLEEIELHEQEIHLQKLMFEEKINTLET